MDTDQRQNEDVGEPKGAVPPEGDPAATPPSETGTDSDTPGTGAAGPPASRPVRIGRFESLGMRTLTMMGSMRRTGPSMQRRPSANYLRRFISTRVAGAAAGGGVGGEAEGKQLDAAALAKAAGRSGKLIVSEDRAEGSVTWAVYGRLLQRLGLAQVAFIAFGLLGGQAAYLYSDYWLAMWASKDPVTQHEARWVWGYAIMACSVLLVSIVRAQVFFRSSLRASTAIHNGAVERLLHAPLSFFHTNPTGRVLNRFSKDQGALDEQLPQVAFDSLQALMMVLGAFVLLIIVVPFILPLFVPLGFAFFWVQRRYLKTSRELKRFEAVTRSPLYAAFSAALKGLPTIRAFRAAARFRAEFLDLLSRNGAWWFSWLTSARWIGFRLDLLVAVLLTAAPLLMMAVHSRLSPRLVGLALTQSLYLAGMLQWMVRQTAEVENNMTSAERLLAYSDLDQEPPTVAKGGAAPPAGWPSQGALRYEQVTAVYRDGLPPVLRDISFDLEGGVSCGVVGRTGSGKSSLMLTLFRLIPVTSGTISIDGIDTSTVGLDALRHQVAIIPQDPVLFSGTLRSNLDPWSRFDDARLWDALDAAQLKAAVSALGGLDARMAECGDNLSAGQRQLLCLARALLQNAAILALDEATANVDRGTDALIQEAVRKACAGGGGGRSRTLVVIAHRIDTILDCDQLLVLSKGELVEKGPPGDLVKSGGSFASMVKAAKAAANAVF